MSPFIKKLKISSHNERSLKKKFIFAAVNKMSDTTKLKNYEYIFTIAMEQRACYHDHYRISDNIRRVKVNEFRSLDQRNIDNQTRKNIVESVRKVVDKLEA